MSDGIKPPTKPIGDWASAISKLADATIKTSATMDDFRKEYLGTFETDKIAHVSVPRHAGKSSMSKAWKEMMETPGYSTEEASHFGGHDKYMEHLKGTKAVEDEKKKAAVQREISQLIDAPTRTEERFMMNQPASLTVKIRGQYKKASFLGGEVFKLDSMYEGKRDGLIAVFTEDRTASLVTSDTGTSIEIPLKQCGTLLDGWDEYVEFARNPPVSAEEKRKVEAEVAEKRMEDNPVYGSW